MQVRKFRITAKPTSSDSWSSCSFACSRSSASSVGKHLFHEQRAFSHRLARVRAHFSSPLSASANKSLERYLAEFLGNEYKCDGIEAERISRSRPPRSARFFTTVLEAMMCARPVSACPAPNRRTESERRLSSFSSFFLSAFAAFCRQHSARRSAQPSGSDALHSNGAQRTKQSRECFPSLARSKSGRLRLLQRPLQFQKKSRKVINIFHTTEIGLGSSRTR